jgi:hypothetical protein
MIGGELAHLRVALDIGACDAILRFADEQHAGGGSHRADVQGGGVGGGLGRGEREVEVARFAQGERSDAQALDGEGCDLAGELPVSSKVGGSSGWSPSFAIASVRTPDAPVGMPPKFSSRSTTSSGRSLLALPGGGGGSGHEGVARVPVPAPKPVPACASISTAPAIAGE